ncbi:exodeoxyribonuclease III [Thermanaerovibrio velox]|uniref:exodeoxyribonuclease III n=1 Tax=Thermanaerovibrio velox TaxID=108007 RepID=UPI002479FE27|nr:exodeoxyribonuclease III [Thermanaerovibrio velox]
MITFNVNSLKARYEVVSLLMGRERPHVLCLQETKVQDRDFPEDLFSSNGYRVFYRGMKSYNGVAVAVLEDLGEVEGHFFGFPGGGEETDDARLAVVRVGGIWVVNCYVPQGKEVEHPDYLYKLRFLQRLRDLVGELKVGGAEVLVVGDLNVAPAPLDVTHPENKVNHVCFHQDVRRAFEELLSVGLRDLFRLHRPGEGEFSFWDYRVKGALERNIGWRIDHILGTGGLAERSLDAVVLREYRAMERPSDHGPVMGVFKG